MILQAPEIRQAQIEREATKAARDRTLRAIRKEIGLKPTRRLAWLLDSLAYREDFTCLSAGARIDLWNHLVVLIQDSTRGWWTVEDDRKTEIVQICKSNDPDRAAWNRLSVADRLLLKQYRQADRKSVDFQLAGIPLTGLATLQLSINVRIVEPELLAQVRYRLRTALDVVFGAAVSWECALGPVTLLVRLRSQAPPIYRAKLGDAAVVALLTLLSQVPPSVVRKCSHTLPNRQECARFFVRRTRQLRCQEHQLQWRQEQWRQAQRGRRSK